jgi:hypothetical protein
MTPWFRATVSSCFEIKHCCEKRVVVMAWSCICRSGQLAIIAPLVVMLAACLPSKPSEQAALDKQFMAVGSASQQVSPQVVAEAAATYARLVQTTTEQFTAKPIKDWLCKTLDPAKGTVNGSKEPGPVSFDCFNLDGRRGSLFNLIAPEVLIKEPIVAGDVFRFSGTIEKVMFVPDMKAVVLFKVQVTALERLQHPQK